jgi:hypothetical protein
MLNSTKLHVPAFGVKRPFRHTFQDKEVSINKIVLVMYRPRYDHGSRTGDTLYVTKKLDLAAGKKNTPRKCSLDVAGGLIFLLDPKTCPRDQNKAARVRQMAVTDQSKGQ